MYCCDAFEQQHFALVEDINLLKLMTRHSDRQKSFFVSTSIAFVPKKIIGKIMGYLSPKQLAVMKFRFLGENVLISEKATIYNCDQITIGSNSRVDDFCVMSGLIDIGQYCHITPMCLIAGGRPGVYLADFCTLAYGARIFSQSDDYSGRTMVNSLIPARFKQEIVSAVVLNRHVVVGAGSTIFPGVEIAEGCAIGAMSLVLKSTEPWGIYAGNPARLLKARDRGLLKLEQDFLRSK